MARYSIEPRTKEYVNGYEFLSFTRYSSKKVKKQLLNTGPNSLKAASTKIAQKIGEFLGNKVADAVTTSNDDKIVKTKPVEEIIIPLEKNEEISNELRQVL